MRKTIAMIMLLATASTAIAQTKGSARRGARVNDRYGGRIERSLTQPRTMSFNDPAGKAREDAKDAKSGKRKVTGVTPK